MQVKQKNVVANYL